MAPSVIRGEGKDHFPERLMMNEAESRALGRRGG